MAFPCEGRRRGYQILGLFLVLNGFELICKTFGGAEAWENAHLVRLHEYYVVLVMVTKDTCNYI